MAIPTLRTTPIDDGWTQIETRDFERRPPPRHRYARTIITRNTSPDVGFDRSISPYKGCEHGCIYYSVTHKIVRRLP